MPSSVRMKSLFDSFWFAGTVGNISGLIALNIFVTPDGLSKTFLYEILVLKTLAGLPEQTA
jgi:ribulose-5-phosphate 4-epimerase/fuculose-1-phosphate aldolase